MKIEIETYHKIEIDDENGDLCGEDCPQMWNTSNGGQARCSACEDEWLEPATTFEPISKWERSEECLDASARKGV